MSVRCGICLNQCSLGSESFSIFPCGHGFCTECISKLFSGPRPKCPNCRVPLHEGDAHPVYIDFISDTQTVTILRNNLSEVDGLHQISADTVTPLMNIKEACQKLEGISNADTSILVEDFKEHIVPVFTKIDTQKEEIDNLWGLIRQLQQENMEILQHNSGPWRAEVMRSKMAAHIQKEENNELRDALRELRRDKTALQNRLKGMGLLQAEVGRWKRAVDVQKEENGILQTELRRLQRAEELLRGKVKKMGPLQDDVERLKTALLNRANLNITKWKERVTELEQKNALYEDVLKKYADINKQVAALKKKPKGDL